MARRGDTPGAAARITSIEGLRAWLAFFVVGYHLLNTTDTDAFYGFSNLANIAGQNAVYIFMMISGFVIAGLLIARQEDWGRYITRRAFRLFPAYWIALAIGGVAMFLKQDAFLHMSWASDPPYIEDMAAHNANVAAVMHDPVTQILLHLGLVQGVPPPVLVPHATNSILGPAWSLSVEWQFYLIAPLMLWMMRGRISGLILVAVVAGTLLCFYQGWFYDFISSASIPFFLYLFVIGMVTRLAFPHLRSLDASWTSAAGVLALGLFLCRVPSIPFWLAFVLLMARAPSTDWLGRRLDGVFRMAFESPMMTWLGARSYSVYILHSPMIMICSFLILPLYPFTRLEALVVVGSVTVALTVFASDLMYRYVELPMIALGSRVANRVRARRVVSATAADTVIAS